MLENIRALIGIPGRLARRVLETPVTRPPATPVPAPREPAPVMVYMEKDRNIRERTKVEDVLRAKNIAYRLLDVSGDQATKAFVVQAAQCEEDDLPVVFVGGDVVGCFGELVQWDVVGSSRVDLQACKLEYSIVSPK